MEMHEFCKSFICNSASSKTEGVREEMREIIGL